MAGARAELTVAQIVRSPRRLSLRFPERACRSSEAEHCSPGALRKSETTLEALRALMWKSKREVIWQKEAFADSATASLVSGELADYLEVQPEFENAVEQLLGEDLPRLLSKQQNIQTLFERVRTLWGRQGYVGLRFFHQCFNTCRFPAHTAST